MEEPIFEKLQPNEVLVLFRKGNKIFYATNKDGVLEIFSVEFPD